MTQGEHVLLSVKLQVDIPGFVGLPHAPQP